MDSNTRLDLLTSLAQSNTASAQSTIDREIRTAAAILAASTDYRALEESLAILNAVGFRCSAVAVDALTSFIRTIEAHALTYSEDPQEVEMLREYRTPESLLTRAIEALVHFRYLQTAKVLQVLLRLSTHSSERVHKKVFSGLEQLAHYDLDVFYGDEKHPGIGAGPQVLILDEIDALPPVDILTYASALLRLLDSLLAPEMEGETWSYRALTLRRANTPAAAGIPEIRSRSIAWLKRLYSLSNAVGIRLTVINQLSNATLSRGGASSPEARTMFIQNALTVLAFFEECVSGNDLQTIQKIEHHSYWMLVRAIDPSVADAALRVEKALARNAEYQIFRTLIGFEGIFGEWSSLKVDKADYRETQEVRKITADEYVTRITENTYAEWRARILKYAEVESDDLATFPTFYYFLERFAIEKPTLALRLLENDSDNLKRFLIPLFRGLWLSNERDVFRRQLEAWIDQGKYLYAATKQFLANADLDLAFLQRIFKKATDIGELPPIRELISVVVSNYSRDKAYLIEQLMLPALEVLTRSEDASWVFDAWFRNEMESVVDDMTSEGVTELLKNLATLRKIDYQAERVLARIAAKYPEETLKMLVDRLRREQKVKNLAAHFEAIPFELHELQKPLSTISKTVVRALQHEYDGNYGLFIHRGARLLKIIFPGLPVELQSELLALVREGGQSNLTFVIAVLRNYDGDAAIHALCREVIKVIPIDSSLLTDVAIALESTGVVSGEFGMAEAYERKMGEVHGWLSDEDEKIRLFASNYVRSLQSMASNERKRAEELSELGRFKYGEQI